MGFVWRRRKRLGRSTFLNLSGSGASISKRFGPVSINSRGRASVRLAKGPSFRFRL